LKLPRCNVKDFSARRVREKRKNPRCSNYFFASRRFC